MNKYPLWKYIVIAVALVVAFLYTLPNFYATVPALQVAGLRAVKADARSVRGLLKSPLLRSPGVEAEDAALAQHLLAKHGPP